MIMKCFCVSQLQRLQADYLDAASALLFEVVVLCQEVRSIIIHTYIFHVYAYITLINFTLLICGSKASRTPALGHFLTISWVFRLLKPHLFLVSIQPFHFHAYLHAICLPSILKRICLLFHSSRSSAIRPSRWFWFSQVLSIHSARLRQFSCTSDAVFC